jgi:hypothetical protein
VFADRVARAGVAYPAIHAPRTREAHAGAHVRRSRASLGCVPQPVRRKLILQRAGAGVPLVVRAIPLLDEPARGSTWTRSAGSARSSASSPEGRTVFLSSHLMSRVASRTRSCGICRATPARRSSTSTRTPHRSHPGPGSRSSPATRQSCWRWRRSC